MTPNEALAIVRQKFPFPDYMDADSTPYITLAKLIQSYVPAGSSVLDFGSGPMDKTAVLSVMGYRCTAVDDLADDWHKVGDNRDRISKFAEDLGIDFRLGGPDSIPEDVSYDLVMLTDVLEHFHDSPRDVLIKLVGRLRPQGHLLITVPNAVNIRKRVSVLLGRTNLPDFDLYYWYPGRWRGHVREYTKSDLRLLSRNLRLNITRLRSAHFMLRKLPRPARPLFRFVTLFAPGWRDSWVLFAQKPTDWKALAKLPPWEMEQLLSTYEGYQRRHAVNARSISRPNK